MEAAADESFAATRASIRFGTPVVAIAAIKEKPFSLRINASSLLAVQPQNYGKSRLWQGKRQGLTLSHERDPAVTRGAIRLVH
jgi:hypothetical protein